MENHPSRNWKRNSLLALFMFIFVLFQQVSITRLKQRESEKTVLCPQRGEGDRHQQNLKFPGGSPIQVLSTQCCLTSVFKWELVYPTW
jgi:hypothetical protein